MIIALAGAKGSGKDEAAKALVADGWHRVAFADPVREMLAILDPIVANGYRWTGLLAQMGYDELKKIPEARRLMQVFATEVVRDRLGANIWRDLGLNAVAAAVNRGESVVITDCRFANETQSLSTMGATIVDVVRPSVVRDDKHVSEQPIPAHLVDAFLVNDGTIEDLHVKIRKVAIECANMA